jgi:glycosyltransferase involved in cell wall biosynthesis
LDRQRLKQTAAIRVHRVIARLNVGGPALHVIGLHAGLEDRGAYDSTLLVGQLGAGEGDMTYVAHEAGVPFEVVPGLERNPTMGGDLRALWWLFRRFRRDRPDIVHTHTAKAGALGRLAAVLARVPVRIHTYHGHVLGGGYFSPRTTTVFRFVERALARLSTRLVVVSPQQQRELTETLRIGEARCFHCIPLGLELERFAALDRVAAGALTRQALAIAPDAWVVGTIGRLVPVKNHSLLLRSFAATLDRLGPEAGNTHLLIAGDGEPEYRAELEALSTKLGIAEHVRWLGWRQDLPDLLGAMDVFALTSDDEGTPVAVIEAICAGTTVVARTVGGVPDVIAGLPTAVRVDSDGAGPFSDALLRARTLHVDPALRDELRRNVADRFSSARLADDIDALYRSTLEETGLSARA